MPQKAGSGRWQVGKLLRRADRPGEGFHPFKPRYRPRRRPPRCLDHFVSHSAKEEGIGLVEVFRRVTMQVFVRDDCTMIAAPSNVTLTE